MKRLILFICICSLFSCKKENASENITGYNWVLKAQVISPAITINGKTSTDYLKLQNPEGCTKNFTYTFHDTGIFDVNSNGALCDMIANSSLQRWTREGDQILIAYTNATTLSAQLKINENTLTQTSNLKINEVNYVLTSTYVPKKIMK